MKAYVFELISLGRILLPVIIAIFLFSSLLKKKKWFIQVPISIFIPWLVNVLYTIYVYNPVGIDAGREKGLHFPEAQFDNNTVSIIIFTGWVYPSLAIIVYYLYNKYIKRKNA